MGKVNIWGPGTFSKILASLGIQFKTGERIVIASADPTITPVNAPKGSYIFYPTIPQWYVKRDNGSTTNVKPMDAEALFSTWGSTGWIDPKTNASLSVVGADVLRLTLAAGKRFMLNGREIYHAAGNYDATISGAAGAKFVYFDDASGTLKVGTDLTTFLSSVPVSVVQWGGAAITNYAWELHAADRSARDHLYKHLVINMAYKSGLALTSGPTGNNVPSPDSVNEPGAVPAVETVYMGTGSLFDEDIEVTVGTAPWNGVVLGSAQTYAAALSMPFYYYNGTTIVRVAPLADRTFFPYSGVNGTPQWNNVGTLTASTTGQYTVHWVFGSGLLGVDTVFGRPHNAVFASLAAAQAADFRSLNWGSFPSAEVKPLYRLISRTNTGWATTHRSKIVDYKDYRLVSGSPVASGGAVVTTVADSAVSITSAAAGNLDPSVETTQKLVNERLSGFGYMAAWVTGTAYRVGNIVKQYGGVYRCITAHNPASAAFGTDIANWEQVSVARAATVVAAGTTFGNPGDLLYCLENETFYRLLTSTAAVDGVYIMTAGSASTRWISTAGKYAYKEEYYVRGVNGGNSTLAAGASIDLSGLRGSRIYYNVTGDAVGQNVLSTLPFGASAPVDALTVQLVGTSNTNTVVIRTNDADFGALVVGGEIELARGTAVTFQYDETLTRWVELFRSNGSF